MNQLLTVVVRFTTEKDLSIQLESFDCLSCDDIELLCICCGSFEEYRKSCDSHSHIDNIVFKHIEGDYAIARTRAATLAHGEFLIFPSVSFKYDWQNILLALKEAKAFGTETAILRHANNTWLFGNSKRSKSLMLDIESSSKNYFQAFGYSLSCIAASRNIYEEASNTSYCEKSHDNAFIIQIAATVNDAMIVGSSENGITRNNLDDDHPKPRMNFNGIDYIDSMRLLLELRNLVNSYDNSQLMDSFQRIYASRIKNFLSRNREYEVRESILKIISSDEDTLSFFLHDNKPDWKKSGLTCFEFTRSAIKTFLKLKKASDYDYSRTEAVHLAKIENPYVSLIVPVYNASPYLKATLDSALEQTFHDFEIICINDGSTDNSLEILLQIAEQDHRVSVYSQPNMGQSIARNAALKVAEGEYVYFFDSDDLLDPKLLELSLKTISEKKLEIVLFDASSFYDSNKLASDHDSYVDYYERSFQYDEVLPGTELMSRMKNNDEYRVSPCLYVTNKSVIEKNNLTFIPGIIHEDNAFTFELMNCVTRASHINQSLYRRRVHSGSVMTSNKTFDNSYGYFACAQLMLLRDFKVIPQCEELANDLALSLGESMVFNSINDLFRSESGQEGGAFALSENELRMYKILVMNIVRDKRKLAEKSENYKSLNERLANKNKLISDLENKIKELEVGKSKSKFNKLFSSK